MKANTKLTISVLLTMVGFSLSASVISVVLSNLISEFSLAGAQQGYFGTANNIFAVAAILSVFLLQGRVNKYGMLVVSMLGLALTMLFAGFSTSFLSILIFYAINGIALGYIETYTSSAILDLHPENSALYMGMLHGFFGIGGLIAPLIAQKILDMWGWRAVYFVFAGLLLMITAYAFLAKLKVKRIDSGHDQKEACLTKECLKDYFGDRLNWILMFAMFMSMGGQFSFQYYVVTFIKTELMRPDLAALALSGFWIACTSCRFIYPRLKLKPMVLLVLFAAMCALFVSAGIILRNGTIMALACIGAGFMAAPGIPVLYNEAGKRYQHMSALPIAALSVTSYLSRSIIPPVIGELSTSMGLGNAMLLIPCLYVCLSVLSLMVVRMGRRGCDENPKTV